MIPPYYISLFLVPMTFTLVQCIKCCLYRARTTISLLFNFTRSVLESIPMTSINAHLIVKERITCLQFTNQSSLIHMLNSVRVMVYRTSMHSLVYLVMEIMISITSF